MFARHLKYNHDNVCNKYLSESEIKNQIAINKHPPNDIHMISKPEKLAKSKVSKQSK